MTKQMQLGLGLLAVAAIQDQINHWRTWRQCKKLTNDYSQLADDYNQVVQYANVVNDNMHRFHAQNTYLIQMMDNDIEPDEFDLIALNDPITPLNL